VFHLVFALVAMLTFRMHDVIRSQECFILLMF